jgi:hypothetical protein
MAIGLSSLLGNLGAKRQAMVVNFSMPIDTPARPRREGPFAAQRCNRLAGSWASDHSERYWLKEANGEYP